MLQFDEYKVKINNMKPDLEKLGQAVHRKMARDELLGLLKCMYGR